MGGGSEHSLAAPRVRAIGSYIPSGREQNAPRLADFSIPPDFLVGKLGILQRSVRAPTEETSDLCVSAFADLRGSLALDPAVLQLCCVVTQNPDQKIPHTSAIVHQKLKLEKHCMTFDVSQGCAGYVHALAIVSGLMTSLRLEHAVIFTCDPYSKIVNPADKNTALIFGDAATATYLTRAGDGYALEDALFGTLPESAACLTCQDKLEMDGRAVLMNATREVPESIRALLARNRLALGDLTLLLLHPGSKRVVDLIQKDLGVDEARMPFEAGDYGNTVSSSIPLMLKERVRRGLRGRLLLCGFGVGFSWGTCLIHHCT